ncbi:hypothetical protein DL237_17000 [Pseudooceanicola sediminis]|uniref:Uncharacterized protein n=1 Tax=Pseudooceanicola sediminis TaxID=2211117 RepID=A0A399IWL2_9RHOB|nr:hypothetical protein [Pseudooceanicola sediminis]KAA2312570.1 hypothetical protein E0K93_17245 [Puniceibacterium sp. HSS470]RII37578.1 hypothetical protein DL237_17000 [Pseudooceanicola sediminis]
MTTTKTRISTIRYNPAERAFEACVTLFDRGEAFTYPISLRAPITMDYADVSIAVVDMAQRRHTRQDSTMRARRPDMHSFDSLPAIVHQATNALWDRLLRRAA